MWDLWTNPYPVVELDPQTGLLKPSALLNGNTPVGQLYRESEDLVLTNVLAFDVKIWDPTAVTGAADTAAVRPGDPGFPLASTALARGAYVDLAYAPGANPSVFAGYPHLGDLAVYDTWSNHYEKDGIDQDGVRGADTGTDGFDNNNNGLVDEFDEWEAPPPYPAPCRGIQVIIRVFEPDSRQIRQVTVVQDFLPK
jgi:hypothetical protein